MGGRLRAADDLLAPAVAEMLRHLDLADEDIAAARLARRYAETIDNAAIIAADLADLANDEDLARRVAVLAAKVDAQTVLDTLGPKLLAVLESLGATPKARAALRKGGTQGAGQGRLARLRGQGA